MLIESSKGRVVITEPPERARDAAVFALLGLGAAYFCQLGPGRGSLPSLIFSTAFAVGGVFIGLRPRKQTVVDHERRIVSLTNIWLWGRGPPKMFSFSDVNGVDVAVSTGESWTFCHPRLLLKTGRSKTLAARECTELEARSVAAAINGTILNDHSRITG